MTSVLSVVAQAQLQDTKRHWEELQNYHYKVNAEREKLQAAKQGESNSSGIHILSIYF